jgi:RimJ/RimL family protein N-acetyltransferase
MAMTPFAIDRHHPPQRIAYRDDQRCVVLRPWGLGDADALAAAIGHSLPELRAFMPWAHLPLSREGEYDFIVKMQAEYWAGREYTFGIFDERDAILGGAGLHPRVPLNPRSLELGYWIASSQTRKGYATLASRLLIALAFDRFGCDRLQVTHDEVNVASARVIEKCGFAYEGTVRNFTAEVPAQLRADGYRGTARHRLYAIVPSDLAALAWLGPVRAAMTIEDALGMVRPARF